MAVVATKGAKSKAQRVPWLLTLEALSGDEVLSDRKNVGGKAARLAWLRRHGFLVPETWVLPQKAFAAALRELSPACEPRSLLRAASGRAAYARAAEARQEILSAKLPPHLQARLAAAVARRRQGDVMHMHVEIEVRVVLPEGAPA